MGGRPRIFFFATAAVIGAVSDDVRFGAILDVEWYSFAATSRRSVHANVFIP